MTASVQPQAAVDFTEIRNIIAALPAMAPVALPELTRFGRMGEWVAFVARAQGKSPELRRPRLALFAGAHGCVADSAAQTLARLQSLTQETDPVVKALSAVDADLRVYELDLDNPTADYTQAPALSESAAAHAMAYGMMAVEPGVQLLALGGIGAGGEAAHLALLKALPQSQDPLATLAAHGGLECCAMVGAIIAARLARVPVLLDGLAAQAAAAVLARLSADAIVHTAQAAAVEPDLTLDVGVTSAAAISRLKLLVALL